jgi:predicted ATPase/DNA-binding SARP family transcriptional activator
MACQIHLFLFGFPRMERAGQPVQVDTRKAIALLAYLAVTKEAVSRDSLAALLWPDYNQVSARAALRRTLSVLNKAMGEGCLEIERERVRISGVDAVWTDVDVFEEGITRAEELRRTGVVDWLDVLVKTLHIVHDRFMAGFSLRDSSEFDDWQYFQSERLTGDLTLALEKLVIGYTDQEKYEQAAGYANQWLRLDPLREEAHRWLMMLFALSGQRSSALLQYRECVRTLDQELGVAPLAETTELYQAILENRFVEEYSNAHSKTKKAAPIFPSFESHPNHFSKVPTEEDRLPLVGRAADWKVLQDVYERSRSRGNVVVLEGEAGIGKTRLAIDFTDWAERQGAEVIRLRCYEGEMGLAYGPFVSGLAGILARGETKNVLKSVSPQALADASLLVPEIAAAAPGLPEPPSFEGPGAQSRFFESLRQLFLGILAGSQTGILALDDIQWADTASLDLLGYLIRRLDAFRVFVLLTYRNDSNRDNDRLQNIFAPAFRSGWITRHVLSRLDAEDISRLVDTIALKRTVPPDLRERLYHETEGLPFFAVAYLESVLAGNQWNLPPSVRGLLQQRVTSVDETARQLLSAAAVIGRSFDFSTLREVSGRSDLETVGGVESLVAAGLVVQRLENGENRDVMFDFSHEKLRDLVYAETSLVRRRLLHRRIAEIYSGPGSRRESGAAASLAAYHYQMAGQNSLAAEYYELAGDHARQLYANREALAHYQAALAAGGSNPARLHEVIGDLHTLHGEYEAAITSYEAAASMAKSECLAGLDRKLGNVRARLGEWELAESHYIRALESGHKDCRMVEQAGIYADWSQAAFQLGRRVQANALAQEALSRASSSGDTLSLAQAYNTLGILARREGIEAEAIEYLHQSLNAAEAGNSLVSQIAALNNLALVYYDMGSISAAIDLNQQALKLCGQIGDRHREAALLNNLADLYHATGRREEAIEFLKKAVVIFTEIGTDSGNMKPEIWKLSEW